MLNKLRENICKGRNIFVMNTTIVDTQNQDRLMDSEPFEPLYSGHLSLVNAFCPVSWVFTIERFVSMYLKYFQVWVFFDEFWT